MSRCPPSSAPRCSSVAGSSTRRRRGLLQTEVSSVVLDAVSKVEQFVDVFTTVYVLTIIAYLLTTWVQLPYSLRPIQRFLADVCDPYLRFWRRILPLQMGPLDFSATVGILALVILDRIILTILGHLH